jgi:osmotically-inducible protein OsmY
MRYGVGSAKVCLLLLFLLAAGCSRQDTERLGRIGTIVAQRVELVVGDAEDDFIQRWKQGRDKRQQMQAARQIVQRLQSDKSLTNCKLEIAIDGEFVELRGQVKTMQQRQHVVEVAESVAGASKLKDRLKVIDETVTGQ